MKNIYLFFLILLLFIHLSGFAQNNGPYLSFGLHGGIVFVDNKPTSEYYSSTGPFLEAEFAVNINRSFAPFIAYDIGTIRKRESSFTYTGSGYSMKENIYLMHYRLIYLGFRYTYNPNNKFGVFAQTQIGLGKQYSPDKTRSHEFNLDEVAGDISIGLGAKYSIIKSLEVSTKAKFHGNSIFSFFGGLNFNLPIISN